MRKQNTDPAQLYDYLLENLYPKDGTEGLPEDFLRLDHIDGSGLVDTAAIGRIPFRYRIIALGFMKHMTAEELDQSLTSHGCPALYPRNFWESTLIFAFRHGLGYKRWKELCAECEDLYRHLGSPRWFTEKKITYAELERYVLENSETNGDALVTKRQTQFVAEKLSDAAGDLEGLRNFLSLNIEAFSASREKTRYYFCKYLYYYLNQRIENYFLALEKNAGIEDALSELLCLKTVTVLRRSKSMPVSEKRALIHESAISCGELFDSFNYFFFGYVNLEWAEILLECYDSPADIPEKQRHKLAEYFRGKKGLEENLSDTQVLEKALLTAEKEQDEEYASEGSRGYGKNRAGENTLYKYIRGTLDIDRTVLVCFLLFFSSSAVLPEEHRLTLRRIDEILMNCGYSRLNPETDDFDWFVTEFIESGSPLDFLDEVVVGYARHQQNSFLFRIYSNAVSESEELDKLVSRKTN